MQLKSLQTVFQVTLREAFLFLWLRTGLRKLSNRLNIKKVIERNGFQSFYWIAATHKWLNDLIKTCKLDFHEQHEIIFIGFSCLSVQLVDVYSS